MMHSSSRSGMDVRLRTCMEEMPVVSSLPPYSYAHRHACLVLTLMDETVRSMCAFVAKWSSRIEMGSFSTPLWSNVIAYYGVATS